NFAFSSKADKKLLDYQYNESLKCSSEVIYKDFFACDNFNVMNTINSISLPTLIICGKEDALTPPKYAEFLQKQIKNSTLVLIEDSGHVPLLERPEEVNNAIEKFIKQANF
ncbi:MAG TPA: alpha/beta hydrolase, partial [Syntrophorhabdaceae bacterium]|nr:alpha/beta hydrolase [Syntrophorhabdaceae bacterium]